MNIVKALREANPYKGQKSQTAHDNSIGFYRACDILQRKFREQPAGWKERFREWYDIDTANEVVNTDIIIEWIEQNLLPASQGLQLEQIEQICLAFSDWFINDNSLPVGGFNMWKDTPTGKALLSPIENASKPKGLPIESEYLFEFASLSTWVNKAASWCKPYNHSHIVMVDTAGNVCHNGEDFMHAWDNDLFPVKVYQLKRFNQIKTTNDRPQH